MSVNQTQHRHIDANLQVVTPLPAADAARDYTTGIDTRSGGLSIPVAGSQTVDLLGNAALEHMEVEIEVDATDTLVNTKVLTFGLQSSKDDASTDAYADIDGLTTQTVTGTAGNVSALTRLRWKLPSACERYIRAWATCPADGGTNTAYNFTLRLLS